MEAKVAEQYILVHLVEDAPVGYTFRRSRGAWPLHMTLAPWFALLADHAVQLRTQLADTLSSLQPFTAIVGGEALFGPERDVPVNLVSPIDRLVALKQQLDVLLEANSAEQLHHEYRGVTGGWRPHITHHADMAGTLHRRFEGDELTVDRVTLVRLLSAADGVNCQIVEHFALGAHRG